MPRIRLKIPVLALSLTALLPTPVSAAHAWFKLHVRDKETLEPLGCARLTTTGNIVLTTDDLGNAAFYEPGLMGQKVWFNVSRQGYTFPADGFGFVGAAFTASEGGSGTFEGTRTGDTGTCSAGTGESTLLSAPVPEPSAFFRIQVIDEATDRGVPLITLEAGARTYVTDSAGLIAFYEPALMGTTTTATVRGHGYELADGDGTVQLQPRAGEAASIRVRRLDAQVAERLYRVTGGGIYRDSVLLGDAPPPQSPVIDGLVMGQDTIQSTVYQGRIFLIWGDTNKPSYPLGNFKASGATALLPGAGGLDPVQGVNLDYYVDASGFAKQMAPSTTVPNPTGVSDFLAVWIDGLIALPDAAGQSRLMSEYAMVKSLTEVAERGLLRFNDATQVFEKALVLNEADDVKLEGHPYLYTHDGTTWAYFHNGGRVLATTEALLEPAGYEVYTALEQGSTTVLDRAADGSLRYTWKTGTAQITPAMIDAGLEVAEDEALFGHITEPDTGQRPSIHELGCTAWNEYRQRFVRIMLEAYGTPSFLGELWYGEADSPVGPWVYARKVITHDDYSFYNPRHHPFFDQRGGRDIFFEGTYTAWLSNSTPTPRYDYNQVMYRLDLEDPRLVLPVPVYDRTHDSVPGDFVTKAGLRREEGVPRAPFMAWDRPAPGSIPVWWDGPSCGDRALVAGSTAETSPVFYALPADVVAPPSDTVPLYHYSSGSRHAYSIDPALQLPGYALVGVLARVWRNPLSIDLPATDYLAALIADAGPDQCLDEDGAGQGTSVVLDGTASSHASGTIDRYAWYDGAGALVAVGATPRVYLAAGMHPLRLVATGNDGRESQDEVVVLVREVSSGCGSRAGTGGSSPTACIGLLTFALLGLRRRARVVGLGKR